MDRKALEDGREFESRFADITGAELVPASGATWFAKLDAEGYQVLWSLKHTGKKTFTLTSALFTEVIDAVEAPGGKGGEVLPGVAIEFAGEDVVAFRLGDFVRVMGEGRVLAKKSKADTKRESSRVPILLREDGNDAAEV
jgi:hypothetical protein